MWIYFPDACISVVVHSEYPALLLARSRLAGDLQRIFPDAEVAETPAADYRFRTTVTRAELIGAVAGRVAAMTYPNVKGAIAKGEGARAYMMNRIWSAGLDAQLEQQRPSRVVVDAGLSDEDDFCSHFDDPKDCAYCATERETRRLPHAPQQPDLFEGRRRRAAGVARVAGNTDPEWQRGVRSLCDAYINRPAVARRLFTAEDLREWCENAVGQPHHPNAWSANLGGLIRSWKARGLIEQVGSQEARRPQAHARLMRCYRVTSPLVAS